MSIENISFEVARYVTPIKFSSQKHIEIIAYGVCTVLTSILSVGSSILVQCVLGKAMNILKLLLFFLPLRISHKGFHCQTFSKCFIVTNLLFFVMTCLCGFDLNTNLVSIMFFIAILMQFLFSYEHYICRNIIYVIIYVMSILVNIHLEVFMFVAVLTNLSLIIGRRVRDEYNCERTAT